MKNKIMKVKTIEVNSFEDFIKKVGEILSEVEIEKGPVVKNSHDGDFLNHIFEVIGKKKGWKIDRVTGWLNGIVDISPIAAFNIVAREVAIELDKKYKDHIENSEKIFVISSLDGRIHEVCKAHIKNYRNFAAFRTLDDAKFACKLLSRQLKGMFSNAKSE